MTTIIIITPPHPNSVTLSDPLVKVVGDDNTINEEDLKKVVEEYLSTPKKC